MREIKTWEENLIKFTAIRTNLSRFPEHTSSEVQCKGEWKKSDYPHTFGKWYFHIIIGGSTGYESISHEDMKKCKEGWCACAGTKGRWDHLFVPQDQLEFILMNFKESK